MDAKATARLTALMRWAEEAAGQGHSVPEPKDLELVAVAKSVVHPDVDSHALAPWTETIVWIMGQASMGVADPYSQLPEELLAPARPASPVQVDAEEDAPVAPIGAAVLAEETADELLSGEEESALGSATSSGPARARSKTPKWEEAARNQTLAAVKRFQRPLKELLDRDANEGDTRLLVTDLLCDGLGYDKFADLTTEYMVRQDFADYGVRIDRQLVAFIEVKRVSQKLNERHLRQVQMYAVNEGIEWMVLTNGQHWQVYHLTGGLPVVTDLVYAVDLLGTESDEDKASQLYYLHKESFRRRQIEDIWRHSAATAPELVLDSLLSDGVLDVVRRDIRRRTGTSTSIEVLRDVICKQLVNAKALERWGK
jgi:hypothetical protein